MIRKFKEADLDKIMEIWLDANIKAHSFISKSYWEMAYGFVKRVIPLTEVYVYEDGGTVCGFIGIEDDYISGLFVEEAFRSKGIGKQLLDHIKSTRSELIFKVYQKNERAIDFYKREKFIIVGESSDGNTKESEFVMSWQKV